MKQDKTKTWQICAVEIYIARKILRKDYVDYELYELLSGNWQIEYTNDHGTLVPNILKLGKKKKLQVFRIPQSFRKAISVLISEMISTGRKNNSEEEEEEEEELKWGVYLMFLDVDIINPSPGMGYYKNFVAGFYPDDPYNGIMKDKLENLILLVKAIYEPEKIECEKFMDSDFDNEIWHLV